MIMTDPLLIINEVRERESRKQIFNSFLELELPFISIFLNLPLL